MRLFYRVATYGLLLGIAHTALTPLFYAGLSPDALWFAGTGLALIFLGLLNVAAERVFEPWILNLCIAANLIGCVYGMLLVVALPAAQAFAALAIFLAVAVGSIFVRLRM